MRFWSGPQRESLAPEERTFKRVDGLQLPLHPLQILGWLVLGGVSINTYIILLPPLSPKYRLPLIIIVTLSLLFHVASHLVALLVDPAEDQVRLQSKCSPKPEFDRTKHQHIIENGRCHLCNVDASGKRTKHCWDCNKCVVGFDHHCKWLNNCIGSRNYRAFIASVVSAITLTFAILMIVIAELTASATSGNYQPSMENATQPIVAQLPGTGSLVVITVVGILSAIAAVLLIHLCLFHGYIACLGLTTYEYMRSRRDKKKKKEAMTKEVATTKYPAIRNKCPEGRPITYHFCESISVNENTPIDANSVYICSSHSQQTDSVSSLNERDRKKFHLYFSYETRSNETTSIELTSRTTRNSLVADSLNLTPLELKPSTPSPVSCCFSMINTQAHKKSKPKKDSSESLEPQMRRSCTTIKRIQSFLRTKLRKSVRQRAINLDATMVRKNKITPLTSPDSVESEDNPKDDIINNRAVPKLPPKLPPLVLNSRQRKIAGGVGVSAIQKRNQQMRMRKSMLRKRPRFKMDSHVTQTAQLSPIPESEQSKPASPQTEHFTFAVNSDK